MVTAGLVTNYRKMKKILMERRETRVQMTDIIESLRAI